MDINDRVGGTKETRVRGVKEADQVPKKIVDIKERVGSWRTDIKFNQISEKEFERDHELGSSERVGQDYQIWSN